MNASPLIPVIPETVTVHLGPADAAAENVTVSFPDYIKNVASSEIYPTWPEAAIRANLYAQISFALNRIYTEFYRSRGYDFDITNDTSIDQSFVKDRDVFENISRIVDDIFTSYIVRDGFVEPLFARYCDGYRSTCNGLSQWGTVPLAEEGLGPFDILTRFYGDDISLVENAPIEAVTESVPPVPLRFGSVGNDVLQVQLRLNRIARNYPAIPLITPPDGVFDSRTEEAVRAFQRIFNLGEDGIVGRATWYRIIYIANAVKRLNEVVSEGVTFADIQQPLEETLSLGSSGDFVEIVQYFLQTISAFTNTVPSPPLDGIFGETTAEAVRAFQREWGLPVTGEVDLITWNLLFDVFRADVATVPGNVFSNVAKPFPGVTLRVGSRGEDVLDVQRYINRIAEDFPAVPSVSEDGIFGDATENAIFVIQEGGGLPVTGVVDVSTWELIARVYDTLQGGGERPPIVF
ncbi:MAG: peptidoglycan-binding protein [Clostridia bacterium]|nr:peptidoglycan-binding protein [Clostridia bacterium]